MEEDTIELTRGNTVIVLKVVDVDIPGDVWVITAEYVREYPVPRLADITRRMLRR